MSSVLKPTGRAGRKSQFRLRLAASATAVVVLSGCVAVDDNVYRRRAPVQPAMTAPDLQQRPEAEVRLSPEAALVEGIDVYPVDTLGRLVTHFRDYHPIEPYHAELDLEAVDGRQEELERASGAA